MLTCCAGAHPCCLPRRLGRLYRAACAGRRQAGAAFSNLYRQGVPEGDNYFTHVLSDPVDFNNPDDISIYLNMIGVSMDNGVWSGTSTTNEGTLLPLHFGFDKGAQGVDSRNGLVYPI